MSAEKSPRPLETFLGLMGALLVLFALFVALDSTPIIVAGWLKLLLICETLSLGVTEICVAWLMHSHLR